MAQALDNDVEKWVGHIQTYERVFKAWESRVDKIIRKYRDDQKGRRNPQCRFNILWSNVQTLLHASFAKIPRPDVSRRFKDNDPVGRVASLILERALEYEVDHYTDYRATMASCLLDRFLGGRGTAWARYEPKFEESEAQITEDVESPGKLSYECSPVDYVHWKDFGHVIARTWEEVPAVWRRVYMPRPAMVERFGEKLGNQIPLDARPEEYKDQYGADREEYERGCVYEIWDKDSGKAIWICKSAPSLGILDERDDPLGLEEFFPCPRPLYATLTNERLEPTPDYALYQYQAEQLDTLSSRIDGLIDAMKVMGVYDDSIPAIGRLFTEGDNTQLFPVKNWAAYAEKGKLVGAMELVDLKPIYEALRECYMAIGEIKNQIYEVTRISDIMRGTVDPREKLGQSQLKSQYGNLGIKAYQDEAAIFATALMRLKAQIICTKYEPQTILQISAADQLREFDKQLIPQAMQLLLGDRVNNPKSDSPNPLRAFRIDIQADSLINLDEQAEQEGRIRLLAANSKFMSEAMTVLMQSGPMAPALVPLVMENWKFGIGAFKVGKALEGAFDEATEKLKAIAAKVAAEPKPPDPALVKVQVDAKAKEQDNAFREKELAFSVQKHADDVRLKQMELAKPEPQQVPEPINPEREQAEIADIYAGIDLKGAQAEKARKDAQVAEVTASADTAKTQAETQAIKMPVDQAQGAMDEAQSARNDIAQQLLAVQEAVKELQGMTVVDAQRILGPDGKLAKLRRQHANGSFSEMTVH